MYNAFDFEGFDRNARRAARRGGDHARGGRGGFGPGGPGFSGDPGFGFGGPGFGGSGFGGRGRGRGGFGRGRRGDVRRSILAVLADGPANGYQIMSGIEERSGGMWRPSPGSVYPALSMLEDEGLIEPVTHDGKKAFALTDAGREHQERHGEDPWAQMPENAQGWLELTKGLKSLALTVRQVAEAGTPAQHEAAATVLANARRDLHRLLADDDA